MKERRLVFRAERPAHIPASVSGRASARLVDLSTRGAAVELDQELERDSSIEFRLELSDGEIVLPGIVRHSRPTGEGYVSGIEFAALDEDTVRRLEAELLRLARERGRSGVVFVFEN